MIVAIVNDGLDLDENYSLTDLVDELAVCGQSLVITRIPRNLCDEDAVEGIGPCYQVTALTAAMESWASWEVNSDDLRVALREAAYDRLSVGEDVAE